MKFYSQEKMDYYKQKARFSLIASIFFISVAVFVFVLSCFFINDKTILTIKIIDCVLLSFSVCFIFFSFVNVINPCKRKINHIYTVMNSNTKHMVCEILSIKKVKTISKNVVATQLSVKCDKLEYFINYNLDCAPRKFFIGKKIEVDVADTFIITEEN